MSDSSTWRLNIGRWFRVPFRVHALFVAVAVFAVYLSTSDPTQNAVGYGLLGVGILFLSVLAHELGHCVAAVRLGGTPEVIVIGPLGGLGTDEPPRQFHGELITAAAGPVVNLLLLVAALPVLIGTGENIAGLLSPIEPIDLVTGAWWMVTAKLVFWINWLLLCVNLLPAFPFDGARGVLRSLLCPALDYRSATHVAVRTSRLTALGVCLLAWWLADVQSAAHLAAWVPLTLLAVFIYFSAQHETARIEEGEWDEELFNYDFSQGYTSLERSSGPQRRSGSALGRWLESRRQLRRRRRQSQEQDEERQVDEILARLHQRGMDALSSKERALLNRVSARYRNRQGS